jgi:hypothetical protein
VIQASGSQRVAGRDYTEINVHQYSAQGAATETAQAHQRRGPLQVRYSAIRPLRTVWEGRLYEIADKVSSEQAVSILCDPLGGDKEPTNVDIKVILYGTEHHSAAQTDARIAAQKCRDDNPDARILIAACDYAEKAQSEGDLCSIVRGWGLSGFWDAKVFLATDELDEWLYEHLTMTIRSERLRGRWPSTQSTTRTRLGDIAEGGAGW